MYTFSSKLKTFSFILMIIGILGIGYGFLTAPKDIQEVERILAAEAHHKGGHEAAGHEAIAIEAHEEKAEAVQPVANDKKVGATTKMDSTTEASANTVDSVSTNKNAENATAEDKAFSTPT